MSKLHQRFRGFLPVVVDVETTGVDPTIHGLLEVAMVIVEQNQEGYFYRGDTHFEHVLPFEGAVLDPKSLAFNQIDPFQPLRFAVPEAIAMKRLFQPIQAAVKKYHCQRAVLVGHNAWFDLLFIKEALRRTKIKSAFHDFTCFDTATLSALIYGQTVLSKALHKANIPFDEAEAHSAIYDAEKTADLFCQMLNKWESSFKD